MFRILDALEIALGQSEALLHRRHVRIRKLLICNYNNLSLNGTVQNKQYSISKKHLFLKTLFRQRELKIKSLEGSYKNTSLLGSPVKYQ